MEYVLSLNLVLMDCLIFLSVVLVDVILQFLLDKPANTRVVTCASYRTAITLQFQVQ